MYRILIISFLFVIHINAAQAQYLEIGLMGGATIYSGEVNEKAFLNNAKIGAGAAVLWNWNERLTTRLAFLKGKLEAQDSRSSNRRTRERNFSFRSDLMELSVVQVVNLLPFDPKNAHAVFTPFILAGVGGFKFDPETYYQGSWIRLQPLGTEGQGLPMFPDRQKYKLYQPALLFGGGLRYALGERMIVGFEFTYRYTFTDYLDDVSTTYVAPRDLIANGELAVALSNRTEEYTGIPAEHLTGSRRGNANNKDAYFFWSISISRSFHGKKTFEPTKDGYIINKWF